MPPVSRPTLLYNDECAVCRGIAAWVTASARGSSALDVRPIGDAPEALALLHPGLGIWDAYAVVHLLMPDGSMKLGGEAVAEVLRLLPLTRGLAAVLDLHIGGVRPGQWLVNVAYAVLSESRPLFGCESCGSTNALVHAAARAIRWAERRVRADARPPAPHLATATHRRL